MYNIYPYPNGKTPVQMYSRGSMHHTKISFFTACTFLIIQPKTILIYAIATIHTIAGIAFHVDVRNGHFSQVDNPNNVISFIHLNDTYDEENNHTGYHLFFDKAIKNAVQDGLIDILNLSDNVTIINIPGLFELDQQGMESITRLTDEL